MIQKDEKEFIEFNASDQSHMRIENEGYVSDGEINNDEDVRDSPALTNSSQR